MFDLNYDSESDQFEQDMFDLEYQEYIEEQVREQEKYYSESDQFEQNILDLEYQEYLEEQVREQEYYNIEDCML